MGDVCRWAAKCPFFEDGTLAYSPEMDSRMHERFCMGEFQSCARYIGRLLFGEVPAEMLPADFHTLEGLIVDKLGQAQAT